ncbi:hypothetical protein IG631_24215 [Alternaria alternata]|nr:hypothetical protein IG631_24215 [Alternaria alternata]
MPPANQQDLCILAHPGCPTVVQGSHTGYCGLRVQLLSALADICHVSSQPSRTRHQTRQGSSRPTFQTMIQCRM